MTWKTLASALESAIAQGLECDAATVGAVPRYGKGPAAVKPPAKVNRDKTRHTETAETLLHPPTIGRDRRTGELPQLKMGCPTPLVRRSMLTIIQGGRQERGGGAPVGHAHAPWDRQRKLVLVK